ncbi:MAG: competence/damage-inducible protein A [Alphaproteobacteria bacterium]
MEPAGASAAVVVIGNEILSGRTRDANLSHLARKLGEVGIAVAEARIVPDDGDAIVEAVNALRARYAYVFTTGGIGPTHDDITAAAVARAFGVPFERNAEAERRLLAYYDPDQVNAARLSMADMPAGVELIDNPVSVAPGFRLANVYVLPGVPKILEAMVELLTPRLAGGAPIVSRALTVFCAEGALAQTLAAVEAEAEGVALGSYPFVRQGRFGTTVVVRGRDEARVVAALATLRTRVEALGFAHAAFDAAATATGVPRAE